MGLPYGDCINIEDDEDLKKNYPHIATLKKNYNLAKSYTVAVGSSFSVPSLGQPARYFMP